MRVDELMVIEVVLPDGTTSYRAELNPGRRHARTNAVAWHSLDKAAQILGGRVRLRPSPLTPDPN